MLMCHHCNQQALVLLALAHLTAAASMQTCHAGTGISLAGVFIYSQVKRMSGKKKVAAA